MTEVEERLDQQIKEEMAKLEAMQKEATVSKTETPESTVAKNATTDEASDPYLEEAIKSGYDPNYSGPNKKSPEQFVKDGSFFKKIEEQKKAINELKKLFQESEARSIKIERETRERTLKELQAQKEEAVAIADVAEYKRIEALERAEAEKLKEVPVKPVQNELPPEMTEFAERNKDWFNNATPENLLMAKAADGLCEVIAEEARLNGETLSLVEQLKRVEERIKDVFPKRFRNVNQDKPALVGGVAPQASGKAKTLADRLSSEQLAYIKKAREYGSKLTNEEYARQLQISGDLKDE